MKLLSAVLLSVACASMAFAADDVSEKGSFGVVINQNFVFGVAFILVGWTATTSGYIGPIAAAILHVAGSLIVIFNSARLVRKGEELEHFHPEPANPASGSDGESRHDAAGQLAPKLA